MRTLTRYVFALAFVCLALGANARADTETRQFLAALSKSAAVIDGKGHRTVYVFVDPNCPYCRMVYEGLQPLMKSYDLRVHWIPVAILGPTSPGKAAAILEAKDPSAALRYNETHYNMDTHSGGIAETIPSAATEAKLKANAALLNKLGSDVVPTLLFETKTGRLGMVRGGAPESELRKLLEKAK